MEDKSKISLSSLWMILKNSKKLLGISWHYERKTIIILWCLTFILALVPFVTSGSKGIFINELIKSSSEHQVSSYLLLAVVCFIAVGFIAPILDRWSGYLMAYMLRFMDEKPTLMILEKRKSLDLATLENPHFNNLYYKVNERGTNAMQNLHERLFYSVHQIINVIIASIILLMTQWWIFLLIVIGTIPTLIIEIKYGKNAWNIFSSRSEIRRRYMDIRQHFSMSSWLIELKLFQNAQHFMNLVMELYKNFFDEVQANEKKRIIYQIFALILSQGVIAFAVIWFTLDVIQGSLMIGTFIFLLDSIGQLKNSLATFFSMLGRQYQDSLFVNDFFDFMEVSPDLPVIKNSIILPLNKTPKIVFENVSFKYSDTEEDILKNFSLTINPGEKLAIVGINGAGKTTFVKLLCRFYDPTEGRILIDGQDFKNIDTESFYQNLGVLFQSYAQYRFPIKEAIAMGRTSIELSLEKVKQAAQLSESDDFIQKYKLGYDQMLGRIFTDGVEPSVGQWQKLAIARVFYRDPRIYIFDEPTSSIDAEAEAHIFKKLESLPDDRTVILISHRFSTVRQADKICVIEDGMIKELGSHEELVKLGGTYARLFALQAKGYQ
jgi:ATP-binding cassette subfamily B protein